MVDDRSGLDSSNSDVWQDWSDWQDWEDEGTSPLLAEELRRAPRDQRSLIQRLAASPEIRIVWRAARAPSAPARLLRAR